MTTDRLIPLSEIADRMNLEGPARERVARERKPLWQEIRQRRAKRYKTKRPVRQRSLA